MLLASLFCIAAGPSARVSGDRWIYTFHLKADEVNGASATKPESAHHRESICQSRLDSAQMQRLISSELVKGCRIHQLRLDGGRISFTGICPPDADGVSFDIDAEGTYDEQSLALALRARATADGDQATMSGTVAGIRTGSCAL